MRLCPLFITVWAHEVIIVYKSYTKECCEPCTSEKVLDISAKIRFFSHARTTMWKCESSLKNSTVCVLAKKEIATTNEEWDMPKCRFELLCQKIYLSTCFIISKMTSTKIFHLLVVSLLFFCCIYRRYFLFFVTTRWDGKSERETCAKMEINGLIRKEGIKFKVDCFVMALKTFFMDHYRFFLCALIIDSYLFNF